jgi:hypothetical protein
MPDDKTHGRSTSSASGVTTGPKPAGASSDATADKPGTDTALLEAAAASGDADVQNLLAQREIAQRNDDQDAIKDIDERLRAGVER